VAFTGNYTCNSFKSGLINGDFDFDTDTIKMALYTNAATLDEDTAIYTTVGEVPDTGTYSAGGVTLTVEKGLTNNTAFISFANATITAAFTARGALIYKDGGVNLLFVSSTSVQIKLLQTRLSLHSLRPPAPTHS
jgi:transcriptional/translational regulatory protein YebC/TACO1